jgi:NAD(P)-dependent dehydrogenase (short-subunit alcohol dehydrogenase family)
MNKYLDLAGMLAAVTGRRRGIGLAMRARLGRKRRGGDHLPTQGFPE